MVQAILEGRKTVTRRVVKLDLGLADTDKHDSSWLKIPDEYGDYHDAKDLCRYKVGDILYIRETWSFISCDECIENEIHRDFTPGCNISDERKDSYKGKYGCFVYRTNYGTTEDDTFPPSMFKWKPSIHMPKSAARIFLKVTDVRVERLRDITLTDLIKEGIWKYREKIPSRKFPNLWNSTIKKQDLDKYGWEANPYVWVIEFKRVEVE
ncbi:hypothetical protein FYJ83_10515 [Tissierella sp. DSM 105185]|uniref:ASCH domain-containing protein n=2 Tax=Tissierella pigra TaxID=2607614 RepID=A0A6N7XIK2_9FIRM|nr:hypothetical protein [Tissierella pigra]